MNKNPKIKALPVIILENKIIIEMIEDKDIPKRVKSNIILPATAEKETKLDLFKEHPIQGYVVAVSEGYFQNGALCPLGIEVGQRVAISLRNGGQLEPFIYKGEKYAVFRHTDVVAIYEDYNIE